MAEEEIKTQQDKVEEQTQEIEKPQETEVKETKSDFDVNSLKEEISKDLSGKVSETVSKSVIEKIGEALGLTKKEEEKLPTNPEDLKAIVDAKVNEALSQRDKQSKEAEQQSEKERETKVNDIIKSWHSEYNSLVAAGKAPKITNPNDPNDKGVQARRKLILGVDKILKSEKASGGGGRTPSLSEVMLANPRVLEMPPGADLPISGNTGVMESEDAFTNKEIRGQSFEELLQS